MTRSTRSSPGRLDSGPRYLTPRTGSTYGHQVAALAALLGFRAMPGQRLVFDLLAEADDAGRLKHRLAVLSQPRRAGKTEAALVHAVWRCLREPGLRVWLTAQTRQDAAETFLELGGRVGRSPLAPRVQVFRGNGSERLQFANGSTLRPFAPKEDSLHGRAADVLIYDEAWTFSEVLGQALLTAAIPAVSTAPESQIILSSAAGNAESAWWAGWVDRLRRDEVAGVDSGVPLGREPTFDEIAAHHPAVPELVGLDALRAASLTMSVADFKRSFGNVPSTSASSAVDPSSWDRCGTVDDFPDTVPYVLGIDVDAGRDFSVIAAAGPLPDGRIGVEVLDARSGVDWLLPRLEGRLAAAMEVVENDQQLLAVCGDDGGPARGILDSLDRSRLLGSRPRRFSTREWATGCAAVFDLVKSERLRHRRQPVLDQSVASATQRPLGDSWVWGRRTSKVPVSPLTAVTAAVTGLLAVSEQGNGVWIA